MTVQLNTDKNIKGTENLETFVNEKLNSSLKHLTEKITRMEVYLSDENGEKSGPDDIQCKLEARLEGMNPVVVASKSDSKEKALEDATKKMKTLLDSTVSKMQKK